MYTYTYIYIDMCVYIDTHVSHMCPMTHWHVCIDTHVSHMCPMTHCASAHHPTHMCVLHIDSYIHTHMCVNVWRDDTLKGRIRGHQIFIGAGYSQCAWHDLFACVTRFQDSLTCVTWLICTCVMTHSHVWHDSFMCATWLFQAQIHG